MPCHTGKHPVEPLFLTPPLENPQSHTRDPAISSLSFPPPSVIPAKAGHEAKPRAAIANPSSSPSVPSITSCHNTPASAPISSSRTIVTPANAGVHLPPTSCLPSLTVTAHPPTPQSLPRSTHNYISEHHPADQRTHLKKSRHPSRQRYRLPGCQG